MIAFAVTRPVIGSAALVALLAACGGTGGATPSADEDERGSVGVPPPANEYCTKLGFVVSGQRCVFPDGTSCEQWSFYRGEACQAHSYCHQHGGSIAPKTEDMGGWTAVYGVCSLNGKQCKESTFFVTGKCE